MLLKTNGVVRITGDINIRYLDSGAFATFSVVSNEKYKDADKSCFIECKLFGRRAEILHQYCKKGSQIYLYGKLEQDTWNDKDTNHKRSKHIINVEEFQMLDSKSDDNKNVKSVHVEIVKKQSNNHVIDDEIPF